jgi:hypothetical protein
MTFDTWQILVNFGTRPLNERDRIFGCSAGAIEDLPLATQIAVSGHMLDLHLQIVDWQ